MQNESTSLRPQSSFYSLPPLSRSRDKGRTNQTTPTSYHCEQVAPPPTERGKCPAHQNHPRYPQILNISPTMPRDTIEINKITPMTYIMSCVELKSSWPAAGWCATVPFVPFAAAPFPFVFPLARSRPRSARRFSAASAIRVRGSAESNDCECWPLPSVTSLTNDG